MDAGGAYPILPPYGCCVTDWPRPCRRRPAISLPTPPTTTHTRNETEQAIEANKQRNLAALKEAFGKALGLSEEEKARAEAEVQGIMQRFDDSVRCFCW